MRLLRDVEEWRAFADAQRAPIAASRWCRRWARYTPGIGHSSPPPKNAVTS